MRRFLHDLRDESPQVRWAWTGMMLAGIVGGIAGLAIGLNVRVATAWFAMFELGLPAAVVGGVVGFLAGWIVALVSRSRRA